MGLKVFEALNPPPPFGIGFTRRGRFRQDLIKGEGTKALEFRISESDSGTY